MAWNPQPFVNDITNVLKCQCALDFHAVLVPFDVIARQGKVRIDDKEGSNCVHQLGRPLP